MWKPIEVLLDTVGEDLGCPITLLRLITWYPEARVQLVKPKRVVAIGSVVTWHDWWAKSDSVWPRRGQGVM